MRLILKCISRDCLWVKKLLFCPWCFHIDIAASYGYTATSLQLWYASSVEHHVWLVVKEVLIEGKSVLLRYHKCPCLTELREASTTGSQMYDWVLSWGMDNRCLPHDSWSFMPHVYREDYMLNREMMCVVLSKIFKRCKGFNWNWVLFVQLVQKLLLSLWQRFQRPAWIKFNSSPKDILSISGRVAGQVNFSFWKPSC